MFRGTRPEIELCVMGDNRSVVGRGAVTLPGPGIIGGPRGLSESETQRREAGPRLTEAECEDEARMQHSRSHNRPDKPEPEPRGRPHSRAQARVSGLSTELLGSVCHRPRPLSHMSPALSNIL